MDYTNNSSCEDAMVLLTTLPRLGPNATAEQIRDAIDGIRGWSGIQGVYDYRDGDRLVPVSLPGGAART